MKKAIKIIALCLCLTLFGVLFTGCNMLDEMKANHAILSKDRETISFRGETYKRLPVNHNLYSYDYYTGPFSNITVTDHDVPVLVADMFSHTNQYDATKDLFLLYSSYSEFYDTEYAAFTYYCNEKEYEKYVNVIENGVLDRIGFEYETQTKDYNYYYTLEAASQEVSEEILGYIKTPEKMSKDVYDELAENYSYKSLMSNIYKCDSEGLLCEPLDGYDILRDSEGNVYLTNDFTETSVKLSDKTADALKDEYFYGVYQF